MSKVNFDYVHKCPECGHDDPDGSEVEIRGNVARQEMYCTECGHSWSERYLKMEDSNEEEN